MWLSLRLIISTLSSVWVSICGLMSSVFSPLVQLFTCFQETRCDEVIAAKQQTDTVSDQLVKAHIFLSGVAGIKNIAAGEPVLDFYSDRNTTPNECCPVKLCLYTREPPSVNGDVHTLCAARSPKCQKANKQINRIFLNNVSRRNAKVSVLPTKAIKQPPH